MSKLHNVKDALAGKLPLGSPEGTDTGCSYPVLCGVDGNAPSYSKVVAKI